MAPEGVLDGRGGRLGAGSGPPFEEASVQARVVVRLLAQGVALLRQGFGAGVVGDGRAVGGGHGCPPRVSMTVRASSLYLSRSRSVSWCHHGAGMVRLRG